MFSLTINLSIIIITCIVSIAAFSNQKITDDLIFYPPAISGKKQYYRFFTCGFIHADFAHLFFNMFSLYLFGQFVESRFMHIFHEKGRFMYLLMYILALGFCLLPTYSKNKNNYNYYSLGASGAVSAVVFAGLLIAPTVRVGFFLIPPIIPGYVFAPLYLFGSYYMEKKNVGGNINHSAHIWGALFGLAFIIVAGKFVADYNAISEFIRLVKADLHLD